MSYEVKQVGSKWEVVSIWAGREFDRYGIYGTESDARETAAALNQNSRN